MRRSAYRSLSLAAILLLAASSVTSQELTREHKKQFTVTPAESVVISNRYGDVTVETWSGSEVAIDVRITIDIADRGRAERLMEMITIDFFENDTAVGATTRLDDRFSITTRGGGSSRFSIDYTVKMPPANSLDISNRYGNIKLAEHPGRVSIDLRYGNLAALRLTRGNVKPLNNISLSYGKAVIEEANWLSVVARYSPEFSITTIQAMMLDSRYSKIIVEKAGSVVADSKYDNISVREINNFVAETGYTPVKIGTLSNKLDITSRYGSFEALKVPAGFSEIDIDASYTGITLGIDPTASYKLNASVRYGSITYCEECLDIQKRIVESTSRELAGVAGTSPNPTATVNIDASYGSVRLK